MEPVCISYNGVHEYYIYHLNALAQLSCDVLSLTLGAKLISSGLAEDIAKHIAGNACLVYLSAYLPNETKAFSSPKNVLESITLDELAYVAAESLKVQSTDQAYDKNLSFDQDEYKKLKYGE